MNNLIKILIFLCVVVALNADQGILINNPSQAATQSPATVNNDIAVNNLNVYVAADNIVLSYDLNLTQDTNSTFGANNKKILVGPSKVFVIDDNNLYIRELNLTAISSYQDTGTTFNSIAISSDEAYTFIATTNRIDVIENSSTTKVASVDTVEAIDVVLKGDTLYVADSWGGIGVLNVANPKLISLDSTISGTFYKLAIENDYLYALGLNGLSVYDISSPSAPFLLGNINNLVPDPSIDSEIVVGDMYAYISDANATTNAIYEVANKKSIFNTGLTTLSGTKAVAILSETIYTIEQNISKYTLDTDYPDDLADANTTNAKTVVQLDPNFGVYGELGTSSDVDIIKLDLLGGKFVATITGMSDLNVSLYNSETDTQPLISVQSSSNILELTQEILSGTKYMRIESTTGSIGEYKIVSNTGGDDWTDISSFSLPISVGESIDGNIVDSNDVDYFRLDVTSKGVLSFTSLTPSAISITLRNSYEDSFIASSGSLSSEQIFEVPSAGTYFIKIVGSSSDVKDTDYDFRADFSKTLSLDKEDDAPFALKSITVPTIPSANDYNYLSVVGSSVFMRENDTTLSDRNSTLGSVNTYTTGTNTIASYKVIGDYVYAIAGTDFYIWQKGNSTAILGQLGLSASTLTHFSVSGNYVYISEENSNRILVLDITDRTVPTLTSVTYPSGTVNDFALKNSYIDNVLRTYLYIATSSGLRVYDYTDPLNIVEIQVFQDYHNFDNIVLSNPYAYVSADNNFMILYVKNPTSLPKLKSTIEVEGITSININQDYAYLVTSTNPALPDETYLRVLDIKDQTATKLLDTTTLTGDNKYLRTKSIAVQNGVGYIVGRDITDTLDEVYMYDMAKDYSDTKNYATPLKFDEQLHGTISQYRADDIDTFYISLQSTSTLDFTSNSDINMTYEIYIFNDDNLTNTFDTLASQESKNTITLAAGEYYMRIHSQGFTSSGAYDFSVTKQSDDYTDSYSDAEFIELGEDYTANISVALDVDMIKVVVDSRGVFEFTTSVGITSTLYYEDGISSIVSDTNDKISITLNPGTYFIKMESEAGFSGNYDFTSNFTPDGSVSVINGFDNISNFNSRYVVYGPRYIYSVDTDNQLSVYNHLLQRVERADIVNYSFRDLEHYCGTPQYVDGELIVNFSEFDGSIGEYTCGHGYGMIALESTNGDNGDNFELRDYGSYSDYTSDNFYTSASDVSYVSVDNNYIYEYSKTNFQIYKLLFSEIKNTTTKKPYAVFTMLSSLDVDNIKSIKNDGNYDFVAIDNNLTIYLSDPALEQYDNATSPPTYIGTFPTVIDSKVYTLEGDIEDIYIDRDKKLLYVINQNSTSIKLIDYSAGVSGSSMSNIDLGLQANNFFVKDSYIYISFPSYGVKMYTYPLSTTSIINQDIANIGAEISNPFTYDGTTVVYQSSGDLQLYLIGDTFKDGTTAGSYSIISDVKEGAGGFEGCFIATAAYGNYFESHVKVLRDFRDDYLLHNELGRVLVDTYYRYSPSIAKEISNSPFSKMIVRVILTPVVYIIKYPFAFLGLVLLVMMLIRFREYIKFKKLLLPLVLASFMFSGCNQTSIIENENTSEPSIRFFVGHIDINSTSSVVGNIDIISEGGSSIDAFEIDGVGSSNFSIAKDGEISILNHTLPIKYDLSVRARNKYGLSEKKQMIVEVTSTDQPVLNDLIINTDTFKSSGNFNESLSIERDGLGSNLLSQIKDVEIVGDEANSIGIDVATGYFQAYSSLSLGQHYFMIRPINLDGVIGPYTSLVINVSDYNIYVDTGTSYTDDYPDNIAEAWSQYTFDVNTLSYSSVGYMDYEGDVDYIGFYVDVDGNYSIELFDNYSYSYSGGDFIDLYDSAYIYIGGGQMYYQTAQPLLAGQIYYIAIYNTSDSYSYLITRQ